MPGKRYSKEEIDLIVELKDTGKEWSEIAQAVEEKFSVKRSIRVLKIIYDRAKAGEPGAVPKPKRARKAKAETAEAAPASEEPA